MRCGLALQANKGAGLRASDALARFAPPQKGKLCFCEGKVRQITREVYALAI